MILLDSADDLAAAAAARMGFVAGITTNPALMSGTGRDQMQQMARLLKALPRGPVFFQPTNPDVADEQIARALEVGGERVVAKLPACLEMFALAERLHARSVPVAITSVFAEAQAVVAGHIAVDWVIVYVDRARRLLPGVPIVKRISEVLLACGSRTKVMGASIKSSEQFVSCIRDGASAATAPLNVLVEMCRNDHTESAIAEFSGLSADSGLDPQSSRS